MHLFLVGVLRTVISEQFCLFHVSRIVAKMGGLDWWSSLRKWVAGGVAKMLSSWLRWPVPKPKLPLSFCRTGSKLPTFAGGGAVLAFFWTSAPRLVVEERRLQCLTTGFG